MAQKHVSYEDMWDGIVAFNKAALKGETPRPTPAVKQLMDEGKLAVSSKGVLEGKKEWFKELDGSKNPKAREIAEALRVGFKKAGEKGEKSEKSAPVEKDGPKFDAVKCGAALDKAAALTAEGKDLSGLTDEEKTMVEIKPATRTKYVTIGVEDGKPVRKAELDKEGKPVQEPNPHAGKVGLTPAAFKSLTGVANRYPIAIARDSTTQGDAKKMQVVLDATIETLKKADALMGIDRSEKGIEQDLEQTAPARD